MKVYLDYAATTPVRKEVKQAMMPFFKSEFGNPSSIHRWGQVVRQAVDEAREKVTQFLNCHPGEIIFTSGGTEADNLALRGISNFPACQRLALAGRQFPISKPISDFRQPFSIPHIITTQIEHHAVLKTCQHLAETGQAEVTYLKPDKEGIIRTTDVQKAIKKNTVLVSIMYINNEIGTIQPIREIGKMIERMNESGSRKSVSGKRIYFHTDAVQAAEYFPMDVDFLHVDLLTISGHKIGAPKGVGALYVRKNTPIKKIIFGGEQEINRRAGTENVAGIVALGKAIEVLSNEKCEMRAKKIIALRDYFTQKVFKEIPDVSLNGSRNLRSPNNANFYFKYIEGESILLSLDLAGIAASSGSACTSLSLEPSHVLRALYDDPERAHGSVRFTLGEETTKEEINYTIKNLKTIVKRLRDISPLTKKGSND